MCCTGPAWMAINGVFILHVIQWLLAVWMVMTWPGYAIYHWILTTVCIGFFINWKVKDVDPMEPFMQIEKRPDYSQRRRAFIARRLLAYVYLISVIVSFLYAIFVSWGAKNWFWGPQCDTETIDKIVGLTTDQKLKEHNLCYEYHWKFVLATIIRIPFQIHIFWIIYRYAQLLNEEE